MKMKSTNKVVCLIHHKNIIRLHVITGYNNMWKFSTVKCLKYLFESDASLAKQHVNKTSV